MTRVGGYWRPLAAVARLLEELGELAETLASHGDDGHGLASELADLWIITTAVADQFLGEVAEPGSLKSPPPPSPEPSNPEPSDPFRGLVAAGGQIARIVNYYDGPKTPRALAGWPPLNDAVAEFHRLLATVAHAHGVDLGMAVADKLAAIPARDSDRFAQTEHDPSTAPCLEQFRLIQTTEWGVDVERARLWGAPTWSAQPLASNVAAIAPTLTSFTRAATRERLDGYVVTGPALGSTDTLDEWVRDVLSELASHDPRHDEAVSQPAGDSVAEPAVTFNGVRLSAAAFSGPYPHILLRPSDVRGADRSR